MFYFEVSGTPYEMGYQHGRAMQLSIGSIVDYLARGVRHWDDAKIEKERQRTMAYTEKRCPHFLEEVQGIADGSGFAQRWIYLINFYAALVQGCTNIIFTQTSDGPLHARTTDLPISEGKHAGVCLKRPKGKPALLTIQWPGCVWAGPAVSEAGLSIGGSSCATCLKTPAEFLNGHVVIAHLMDRCQSVAETVKLLGEFNGVGWGASYAMLDKSGDAAIVEKAGDKLGVRRPNEHRVWCANAPLSPELCGHPPDDPLRLKESQERFDAVDRLTRNRPLNITTMKQVLAYSDNPGAVSHYGEDNPLAFETECAQIMRPADGVMHVCFTHPDRDPWRTFSIRDGWIDSKS